MYDQDVFGLGSRDSLAILAFWTCLAANAQAGGFVLAGEPLRFDAKYRPLFTARQLELTAESTRLGLIRWAATEQGKRIIGRFESGDREVFVTESAEEKGIGRAPQPGLGVMTAYNDRSQLKRYELILNPQLSSEYGRPNVIDFGLPKSPAEAMAAAWAAEMLHIDFYSRGIRLPHHRRSDFQQRWRAVAAELGLPAMDHGH